MADTRSFEERQRDLIGVERAARLVGVEEIERQRRTESKLRGEVQALRSALAEIEHAAIRRRGVRDVTNGEVLVAIAARARAALLHGRRMSPPASDSDVSA